MRSLFPEIDDDNLPRPESAIRADAESAVLLAKRVICETLLKHGRVTCDDVRRAIELPDDVNPTIFAEAPRALLKAGAIHRVGFRLSERVVAHHRPVSVWEIADRRKLESILATLPRPTLKTEGGDE